jgi:hypothetical protein
MRSHVSLVLCLFFGAVFILSSSLKAFSQNNGLNNYSLSFQSVSAQNVEYFGFVHGGQFDSKLDLINGWYLSFGRDIISKKHMSIFIDLGLSRIGINAKNLNTNEDYKHTLMVFDPNMGIRVKSNAAFCYNGCSNIPNLLLSIGPTYSLKEYKFDNDLGTINKVGSGMGIHYSFGLEYPFNKPRDLAVNFLFTKSGTLPMQRREFKFYYNLYRLGLSHRF